MGVVDTRLGPGEPMRVTTRVLRHPVKWLFRHGLFPRRLVRYRLVTGPSAFVLLCLWNRPDRLEALLTSLDGQRDAPPVRLFVWNNAARHHERYLSVLRDFAPTGALAEVRIVRSPVNLGAMARFYWAAAIARRWVSVPVVVVDDDEELEPTFLRSALDAFRPGAIAAWWAFVVRGDDYWDREPAVPGGPVNHIGPGGIVCEASIFRDGRFFTQLPDRYFLLDDIWLTHWATTHGITLTKLDVAIGFVQDEANQVHGQLDLKPEFLRHLRAQ